MQSPQMSTKTLQHVPFRPARKDLAEAVFLNEWKALNTQLPTLLTSILGQRPGQRDARVAASFITWIGTQAGASFLAMAKGHVETFSYPQPAYLATWALVNRRERHVSAGVRTIEIILSDEDLFKKDRSYARSRAARLPISMSDMDVIESMVTWISTAQGDAFLDHCTAQHKMNVDRARAMHNIASTQIQN